MGIDRWALYRALGYEREIETRHFGRRLYPVPEVRAMHESKARFKVVIAPARSGKSYSGAWDVVPDVVEAFFEVLDGRREFDWAKFLIIGPTYGHADKEFGYLQDALVHRRERFEKAFGATLPEPTTSVRTPDLGRLTITWDSPWRVQVFAASGTRLNSVLGDQYRVAILAETAELPDTILRRGLETRVGRFLLPTTPSVKGMWIKTFVENARSVNDDQVAVFHYPPEANPDYDLDRFKETLKRRGREDPYFREQFLAEFAYYGGRVFPQFEPTPVENVEPHLTDRGITGGEGRICIEPFDIPHTWRRFGAIDFGWNDPTCFLWIAISPRNELFVIDEYYESQRGSRDHVNSIRVQQMRNRLGEPRYVVRDKHGQAKQIAEDMLREYDFPTLEVENSDRIAGRVQVQDYLSPSADDGLPRLRIFAERCPNLVRELTNLHYDEEGGVHREGQQERYLGEDHAYDALRYACMSRPSPAKLPIDLPQSGFRLDALLRHRRRLRRVQRMIGHQRDAQGRLPYAP